MGGANPLITGCKINGNDAGTGGGIYIAAGLKSPVIEGYSIADNSATSSGGIAFGRGFALLPAKVTNCIIAGNIAGDEGGGILVSGFSVALKHSTISDNHGAYGGGVFYEGGMASITNSILWGDRATYGPEIASGGGDSPERSHLPSSHVALRIQQSPLQQRLHVTTAIDDQQNEDALIHNSINDAVGFEEDLAVFVYPQRHQFIGIGTSLREFGQTGEGFLDLLQNVVRSFQCIVRNDITIKFFEIMCSIMGQPNREGHQRSSRCCRRRFITSSAGRTLLSSI